MGERNGKQVGASMNVNVTLLIPPFDVSGRISFQGRACYVRGSYDG